MSKKTLILRSFFVKALPNIGMLTFFLLCLFWGFPNHPCITWLGETIVFKNLVWAFQEAEGIGEFFLGIWGFLLFYLLGGFLTAGLAPIALWGLLGILLIYDAFACGFTLMTVVVVCIGLIFLWIYAAAAMYHLGTFEADSTTYIGYHHEIHVVGDHFETKKVNDYSGGGEWFLNILIYLGRLFILSTVGIILFIIDLDKIC